MTTDLFHNLIGSAFGGVASRLLFHPIDTLKSRIQSGQKNCDTLLQAYKLTIHENGIIIARKIYIIFCEFFIYFEMLSVTGFKGLYRGLGTVIVGGVPGTCIYFTGYDTIKSSLKERTNLSNFTVYLTSGLLAEAACCIVVFSNIQIG